MARYRNPKKLWDINLDDSLDLAEVGAMDAEDIQDMLQKCMGLNEEDLIEFASAQQL